MKYRIKRSSKFKKDYKRLQHNKRFVLSLKEVLAFLVEGKALPEKYCDHALQGRYKGLRDCHVLPDIVLIYEYQDDQLLLNLVRVANHSQLF